MSDKIDRVRLKGYELQKEIVATQRLRSENNRTVDKYAEKVNCYVFWFESECATTSRQFCCKINLIVKRNFIKIMSMYYVLADRGSRERYLLGSCLVCPSTVQGIYIVIGNYMVPSM